MLAPLKSLSGHTSNNFNRDRRPFGQLERFVQWKYCWDNIFKKLSNWFFVDFTSCSKLFPIPLNLPFPLSLPSALATSPYPNFLMEAAVWQWVTQYTLYSTHLDLWVFIAMSHLSDVRPLVSAPPSMIGPHWDSFWMSCHCPMLWRSRSFGICKFNRFTCSSRS